jgi:hypothetical protein
MRVICCVYEPFVFSHSVYAVDMDGNCVTNQEFLQSTSDMTELCKFIADEYQAGDYSKVILYGLGSEKFANDIKAYSILNYKNSNIEIEVIQ